MSQLFSIKRLGLLLRADLITRFHLMRIASITLVVLMILLAMISSDPSAPSSVSVGWIFFILFILGPLMASRSFREMHDKNRNEAYLLLPASAFEKMLSRLLLVTVAYTIYAFLLVYVASIIYAVISLLISGRLAPLPSLSGIEWHEYFRHLLVIQSVFFLGAAWFRKNHFIKTLLTAAVTCIGFFIVTLVIGRIGLGGLSMQNFHFITGDLPLNERALGVLYNIIRFTFYIVLPPFCWWLAWLRIKEMQVSHGV